MQFSIIIPTFNRCHLLWKTLLSIKSQSYSDFEVLIIDDGSIDKTRELVGEFLIDKRFQYHYKENGGASSARNLGLELSIGKLVTYIDSDEEVFCNYLEVALEFFESNEDAIFGISNYNRVLENYNKSGKMIKRISHSSSQKDEISFEDIYNWNIKTCGTGIFHKNSVGINWDESLSLLEDLDFLISIGKKYPDGFIHIPYALFEYKQRYNTDGQCSQARFIDFSNAFQFIYEKHKADLNLCENSYLGRVKKYKVLQEKVESGEITEMKNYIFSIE